MFLMTMKSGGGGNRCRWRRSSVATVLMFHAGVAVSLLLFFSPPPLLLFAAAAPSTAGDRYSFSLTTFDPSGRLGQVERAIQASSLTKSKLAVAWRVNSNDEDDDDDTTLILCTALRVPSALVLDDGTSQAGVPLTSRTVGLTISGSRADGRRFLSELRQAAIEQEYTMGVEASLDSLLEQASLLMQRQTRQAGARPWGCSLWMASVGDDDCYDDDNENEEENNKTPQLLAVDPSGSVVRLVLDPVVVFSDQGGDNDNVAQEVSSRLRYWKKTAKDETTETPEEALVKICQEVLLENQVQNSSNDNEFPIIAFLTTTLSRKHGLKIQRWNLPL